MRALRVAVIGTFILALLGGLGGAALSADQSSDEGATATKPWFESVKTWQDLDDAETEKKKALAAIDAETAAVRAKLVWQTSWQGNTWRWWDRAAWQGEHNAANYRLNDLLEAREPAQKALDQATDRKTDFELDPDAEKAAKEAKAFLEKYPVPVGDHVHYLVQCLEDGKEFHKQHGNDVPQLKAALEGTEFCLKNPERPMTRVIRILYWDNEAADETVPAPLK